MKTRVRRERTAQSQLSLRKVSTSRRICFSVGAILAATQAWGGTESFVFDTSVDIGSDVGGLNDWSWDHFLGIDIDKQISVGGIAGKKNATIIPAIDFGLFSTPAVKGDTRTGLKLNGGVDVKAGLEVFADFDAGGLSDSAVFDFAPSLELPDTFAVGEFISLSGSMGLSGSAFNQGQVDLPSISMGADVILELDVDIDVEAAVPVVLPYRKTNFSPDPINERVNLFTATVDMEPDQDDSGFHEFQFLPGLEADLLPDFTLDVLPGQDPADPVFSKQISIEPKAYVNDAGETIQPKAGFNIDIGEVQVFKPVRNDTLFVDTAIESGAIKYTVDTNIASFGLDIDGIISAAIAGQSFTEFEASVPLIGDLRAELFDFKYGPEFGYLQDQEITPTLHVTLEFSEAVLINDNGILRVVTQIDASWDDLPEISVLGDEPVDVTVKFTDYEASLVQRGAITIGDYWEFSALEFEFDPYFNLPGVNPQLQLGPVIHERGPGLSSFLGEIELDVFNEEKSLGTYSLEGHVSDQQFTLTPLPSTKLYLSGTTGRVHTAGAWRELSGDGVPAVGASTYLSDFGNTTLVIGGKQDVNGSMVLTPTTFVDAGQPGVAIDIPYVDERNRFNRPTGHGFEDYVFTNTDHFIQADALNILEGSVYQQSGVRGWKVSRIRNDGLYESDGLTRLHAKDGSLLISGQGEMRFDGLAEVNAALLSNGSGHTLTFNAPSLAINTADERDGIVYVAPLDNRTIRSDRRVRLFYWDFSSVIQVPRQVDSDEPIPNVFAQSRHQFNVTQTLQNAGTIEFNGGIAELNLSQTFENTETGTLRLGQDSFVQIVVPDIVNDGKIEVLDASALVINRSAGTDLTTNGHGVMKANGVNSIIDILGPTVAKGEHTFIAENGGVVNIRRDIGHGSSVPTDITRFVTDTTGEIRLNGLSFNSTNGTPGGTEPVDPNNLGTFDIVNEGLLILESGQNVLYNVESGPLGPGGGGDVVVPRVTPINLVNTGTVRILQGAEFGFEIEIEDYAEGGATLAGGTWELIGDPSAVYNNTTRVSNSNRSRVAALTTRIAKVTSADGNILGVFNGKIDGDFDGDGDANGDGIPDVSFNLENFDTQLRENAANILISGAAYFPYLNTMSVNSGTFRLTNNHHFYTEGDLVNTGLIETESGGALRLNGLLTVDEGEIRVTNGGRLVQDSTEGITVLGGTVLVDVGVRSLNVNTPWVVQDKWLGEDGAGNDIIAPALVDYAGAWFPTIGTNADITLSGEQARFTGLEAVNRINGKLTITDGNTFVRVGSGHNVEETTMDFENFGTLEISNGGKVYVADGEIGNTPSLGMTVAEAETRLGRFENFGTLIIDDTGFLKADSVYLGGDLRVDGVIEANDILTDTVVTVSGTGLVASDVRINGTLAPGNSAGRLEVLGDVRIENPAILEIEIEGGTAGETYDQLVLRSGFQMDGNLVLAFDPTLTSRAGQEWRLVDMLDGSEAIAAELMQVTTVGLASGSNGDPMHLGMMDSRNIFLTTTGGDGNDLVLITEGLGGDIDESGLVNSDDIDALNEALALAEIIPSLSYLRALDLNDNEEMNQDDVTELVRGILATEFGDVDLDRDVDADDLAALAASFDQSNLGWSDGDLNGDTFVDLDDLTILGTFFGFGVAEADQISFTEALAASGLGDVVPEPVSAVLVVLSGAMVSIRRRRAA